MVFLRGTGEKLAGLSVKHYFGSEFEYPLIKKKSETETSILCKKLYLNVSTFHFVLL
jgi:hypothetical protein